MMSGSVPSCWTNVCFRGGEGWRGPFQATRYAARVDHVMALYAARPRQRPRDRPSPTEILCGFTHDAEHLRAVALHQLRPISGGCRRDLLAKP
jgi:hypothetical protein